MLNSIKKTPFSRLYMKDLQKKQHGYFKIFIFNTLLVFSLSSATNVTEDDVRCLQGVKNSLADPRGNLLSWNFANRSAVFLCNFTGVTCWDSQENRLFAIKLRRVGLSGKFPDSLMYCGSLLDLDLSGNDMYGAIPSEICTWLPFLVNIDLSNNSYTGPIPSGLANCKYLNSIQLSDNRLTGSIPPELSSLSRLKEFSVANNLLSGAVPSFFNGLDEKNFVGNKGLCGGWQLRKCGGLMSNKNLIIIIMAGVGGAALGLLLAFGLRRWYFVRPS